MHYHLNTPCFRSQSDCEGHEIVHREIGSNMETVTCTDCDEEYQRTIDTTQEMPVMECPHCNKLALYERVQWYDYGQEEGEHYYECVNCSEVVLPQEVTETHV